MDLEDLAEEAKKENIISIVVLLSKSDGEIHENEFLYLLKLGLSFGLTDEKIREIIYSQEDFIYVPNSEPERVTILYYLMFLMKIDGVIKDEEISLMHHFGFKLGFNGLFISNLIDIVKEQKGIRVDPALLLKELKVYLN